MQQFSCGSIGFDFTLLIAGEGIDSAAENYGRFFLSQPQFLAYAAEFLTLPLTGALDKFIARLAVPDLVGVVEPAVLTRRAKPAGKTGEGDGLTGITDGFGAILFAYHTLVSATHALNDFAHGSLHLLFFKLDHGPPLVRVRHLDVCDVTPIRLESSGIVISTFWRTSSNIFPDVFPSGFIAKDGNSVMPNISTRTSIGICKVNRPHMPGILSFFAEYESQSTFKLGRIVKKCYYSRLLLPRPGD